MRVALTVATGVVLVAGVMAGVATWQASADPAMPAVDAITVPVLAETPEPPSSVAPVPSPSVPDVAAEDPQPDREPAPEAGDRGFVPPPPALDDDDDDDDDNGDFDDDDDDD